MRMATHLLVKIGSKLNQIFPGIHMISLSSPVKWRFSILIENDKGRQNIIKKMKIRKNKNNKNKKRLFPYVKQAQ
jgi:hypothetical protein